MDVSGSDTHSAFRWFRPGWGKWWTARRWSGAAPSPTAWRRWPGGRSACARERARLQTALKSGQERQVLDTSPNCAPGGRVFRTIDDFLPFCLFLAEARQGFGGGQLPPVGRVLLKLQQAGLHLLQLRGRARRGLTLAFGNKNWPFETEEFITGNKKKKLSDKLYLAK